MFGKGPGSFDSPIVVKALIIVVRFPSCSLKHCESRTISSELELNGVTG